MNIVPHNEFVEREQAQHGLFDDIPSFLFNDGSAEIGKDKFYIYTAPVFWQFFQHIEVDAEILFKQFNQGNIQKDVLVSFSDDIAVAASAHNINREQKDRSITSLLTF